jgi:hypothetical protein
LDLVAVELLNPLQVDDGHHADQQVRVLGDVDLGRDHRAVQAFVKQQIGAVGTSSHGVKVPGSCL